ncbi:LpqN/LpqT family lipoprotein [Mycobacterium sp. ACS1612]|uniref:LpqN/LpqT family lipoprotein n=1 Tax=Mycobacterium sp. ACS1612 TaxID=1834117 RepID=UPI000AF1B21C|nr:LpqN/LpqT family lipoprotein [Mycobacterium sp. ACS1612]
MPSIQTLKKVILPAAMVGLMIPLSACVAQGPADAKDAEPVALTATASECTRVDAPMLDIPSARDTEPRLRIPQPSGWRPTNELDGVDEAVRFAIAAGDGQRPQEVAVVTMEPIPDVDAQLIFDDYRAQLEDMLAAKDLSMTVRATATTVCGQPAETLSVTNQAGGGRQGAPATQLAVVAEGADQTYLVTLVTTAAPNSAKSEHEVATILAGFAVLPPAASQL